MKTTQDKITSLSKAMGIVTTIGFALLCVANLALVAAFIMVMLGGKEISISLAQQFLLSGVTDSGIKYVMLMLVMAFVYIAVLSAQIFILSKIFKDISRDAAPFNKIHTPRIKLIALLQIIISFVGPSLESAASIIRTESFEWPGFDLSGVIFGVMLYFIALLYDYGCELQTQSDETL